MDAASPAFKIEREQSTVIVTPQSDIGEFDYPRLATEAAGVVEMLSDKQFKNLIVDLHKTDYIGSSTLGFFVKLWNRVSGRQGKMVLCGVSAHVRDVLKVTKLDSLWSIVPTREEALAQVNA